MKKIIQLIILLAFHQTSLLNAQTFKDLSKTERIAFLKKNNLYSSLSKQKNVQSSSKTIKQVLDSIVSGKHLSNPNGFEPSHKEVFQYDPNERINLNEVYSKYEPSNNWQYSLGDIPKKVFINNGDYDFTFIVYDNQLNLDYKYEYFHNANNQLTLVKFYNWDYDLNNWFFSADIQIFHQGTDEDYRIYRFYNETLGQFINAEKYEKNYSGNKQINTVFSEWNENLSNWNDERKYEFTYNTNNKVTLVEIFQWDSINWVYEDEYTYTYDSNDRLIIQSRSTSPSLAQYHYEYDNQNNITNIKSYFVSSQTSSFENEFYYDLNVTADQTVIPKNNVIVDELFKSLTQPFYVNLPNDDIYTDFLVYNPTNKLDSVIAFNYWSTPTYEGRYYYYYSQQEMGINTILDNPINIFPNPTTNFINIEESSKFESFELIDIKGELILKNKLNSSKIDVSSLQNGIYFLNLFTDDKVIVRNKIIKE